MHKWCTINLSQVSHNAMQGFQRRRGHSCSLWFYLYVWYIYITLWNQHPIFFLTSEQNNNNKTDNKVLKTKTIRINGNGLLGRNVSLSCSSSIVMRWWGEKQTHFPSTLNYSSREKRQIRYDITRGKYVQSDVTGGDCCDLQAAIVFVSANSIIIYTQNSMCQWLEPNTDSESIHLNPSGSISLHLQLLSDPPTSSSCSAHAMVLWTALTPQKPSG